MAISKKSLSSKSKSVKTNNSRKNSANNSNSDKNNSNLSVSKCGSTFCEKVVVPKMKKMLANISKSITKKFTPEKRAKFIKSQKTINDDVFKQNCMNSYCNSDCKNTVFEAGSKIPNSVFVKLKSDFESNPSINKKDIPKMIKNTKKMMNEIRKDIFKNKKNVIKNNFYEKLKPSDIKEMKKKGAISGCTIMKPF